jgi:NitT/TauT family transport system substrate-binding protein
MHMPLEDTLGLNLLAANQHQADHNRARFDAWNLLCLNVMSSPGAGKTSLLERSLAALSPQYAMAVLEGDMTTQLDAQRLAAVGVPVVPITTGRACHLDAAMVHSGLHLLAEQLDPAALDLLWVENVGNLVCPAEFAVGEHRKVALLSVTEGDDKPLKYPVMFREADCVLITKVDLLPHLPIAVERIEAHVRQINPHCAIFRVSATSGAGLDAWHAWLHEQRAARAPITPAAAQPSSSRRRLLALLLAAALGGAAISGCSRTPPTSQTPVRLGFSAWPGWFPWQVSQERGLFAKAGVPVALQWFDGYLDSINALNAGQLDCNSQTLGDTISSVAGGADLVVVLTNDNSTGNDQVIAAPGIRSVADLKGKKVAAEEGTVDHYLLLLGLKKAGLSPADITFVPLETGAAAAAFVAGKVDAVGVFAPFTTQALKRPGSTTLFSSREFPGAISDHLVCRRDFVAQHPEKIQKIVNTWFATLAAIQADPAGTLPILAARAGVNEADYKTYAAGTRLFSLADNRQAFQSGTTMASLPFAAQQISAFLQQVGLARTPPNLKGLLEPRFVNAVP